MLVITRGYIPSNSFKFHYSTIIFLWFFNLWLKPQNSAQVSCAAILTTTSIRWSRRAWHTTWLRPATRSPMANEPVLSSSTWRLSPLPGPDEREDGMGWDGGILLENHRKWENMGKSWMGFLVFHKKFRLVIPKPPSLSWQGRVRNQQCYWEKTCVHSLMRRKSPGFTRLAINNPYHLGIWCCFERHCHNTCMVFYSGLFMALALRH